LVRWLVLLCVSSGVPFGVIIAQGIGDDAPDLPLTAAQMTPSGYLAAAHELADDSVHGMHLVLQGHRIMQRDSVTLAVDAMTRQWIVALQREPIGAFQRMQMAALHIRVGQDDAAAARIAAVLATPHLEDRERGWVLASAIDDFLGADSVPTPARLARARAYYAQLCMLPPAVTLGSRFAALGEFMEALARMGRPTEAIQTGLQAYTLLSEATDDELRIRLATSGMFVSLSLLLSGQPHGRARIDSLATVLQQAALLPPAVAARDPALAGFARQAQQDLSGLFHRVAILGRPGVPLIATHWLNQPVPTVSSDAAPGAHAKAVNDGVIRIIGFGWLSCPWCKRAMIQMQHELGQVPFGVSLEYYEYTEGQWGGRFVEPEEEVAHLRHYFLERRKFTYPIAIWAGPKDSTPDGGRVSRKSPTVRAYSVSAGPTFIVLDAHGIVRDFQEGYRGYDAFKKTIEQLLRERDHPGAPVTPVVPSLAPAPASQSSAASPQ